jgi:hypothetical protein
MNDLDEKMTAWLRDAEQYMKPGLRPVAIRLAGEVLATARDAGLVDRPHVSLHQDFDALHFEWDVRRRGGIEADIWPDGTWTGLGPDDSGALDGEGLGMEDLCDWLGWVLKEGRRTP